MSDIIKFINARPHTKTDMRISSGMEAVKAKTKRKRHAQNVKPELVQMLSPVNNNNNNS
jgi:hypothetical protein